MKPIIQFLCAIAILIVGPQAATAFDRITTDALKGCHDYIWLEVPKFNNFPNAAISVFPGIIEVDTITVFRNVMWDDPLIRSAGNCVYVDGEVTEFNDYTDGLN